jgi:hypothetical protein
MKGTPGFPTCKEPVVEVGQFQPSHRKALSRVKLPKSVGAIFGAWSCRIVLLMHTCSLGVELHYTIQTCRRQQVQKE